MVESKPPAIEDEVAAFLEFGRNGCPVKGREEAATCCRMSGGGRTGPDVCCRGGGGGISAALDPVAEGGLLEGLRAVVLSVIFSLAARLGPAVPPLDAELEGLDLDGASFFAAGRGFATTEWDKVLFFAAGAGA